MIKVITKGDKYIGLIEVSKLAFYFDWNYCKKNYDNFNNPRIQIYWETEDDRVGGIITDFKSPVKFSDNKRTMYRAMSSGVHTWPFGPLGEKRFLM